MGAPAPPPLTALQQITDVDADNEDDEEMGEA
jgi:hypothetical protein